MTKRDLALSALIAAVAGYTGPYLMGKTQLEVFDSIDQHSRGWVRGYVSCRNTYAEIYDWDSIFDDAHSSGYKNGYADGMCAAARAAGLITSNESDQCERLVEGKIGL